jgi:outer membrane protein OmpA-like peptidoglycan-associated protein
LHIDASEKLILYSRKIGGQHSVWQTAKRNDKWSEAEQIDFGPSFKNARLCDLSADGQTVLLNINQDLYLSRLDGLFWSPPMPITEINLPNSDEQSGSLSYDERILYFSSNRPGGKGGYDIYISFRQDNGTWGKAINVSNNINTSHNEITPKFHTDGQTLFYSSDQPGEGGYDVYHTAMLSDSTWSEPRPLSFGINTADNETNFSLTVIKKYLSWNRSKIGTDTSHIICNEVFGVNTYLWQVVYTGQVQLSDRDTPGIVSITISDANTKEIVGEYHPNEYTGLYTFVLAPERKYNAYLSAPGYLSYTHDFWVSEDSAYNLIRRSIQLESITFFNPPMKVVNGQRFVEVSDVVFDLDGFQLKNYSRNLNKLADYLIENPECVIEIGGHADAIGNADYNKRLSRLRALEVSKYLLSRNVKSKSFLIRDYGQQKPIAKPDILDAQSYNRRVEFKVIKEGNTKLKIQHIEVPSNFKLTSMP